MIKQLLENNRDLRLRVSGNLATGHIHVSLTQQALVNVLAVINGDTYPAYHLPWKSDTGYYLDVPTNAPAGTLFITAELSGCCVGVRKSENTIRICHYNQTELFTHDELSAYPDWLLPEKRYNATFLGEKYIFNPSDKYQPALFWGEKESRAWKFYYQMPDGVIHNFPIS